jgi:hypothetical protein
LQAAPLVASTPCKQPTNQSILQSNPINPPHVFLQQVFYKQGGGATVLGGGDIVTRETYDPTSLNINNLGKAAVLHVAFTPFWSWGYAKLSL